MRSHYPYYSDEFDERNLSIAGATKDNSQWNLYNNWIQTTLFQVLFQVSVNWTRQFSILMTCKI